MAKDSNIQITVRFKSELASRYEAPVGSGNMPGALPQVHHVDLIVGDVGERARPGTLAYDQGSNPSSHVVARFSAAD